MDNDFSEKLKNVLSNPEAMAQISAIASGLGVNPTNNNSENTADIEQSLNIAQPGFAPNPLPDGLPNMLSGLGGSDDPRIGLLYSLKPLLKEEKQEKIDALTKALTIASLMKKLRK